MPDAVSLALIQSIVNHQNDLIVVFHGDEVIITNKTFNDFYNISSYDQYKKDFGGFVNHFVAHPSYFNKDKMQTDECWCDAILKLPELERIVSMMTPSFEPHAFSVAIDKSVAEYSIVTFSDITQNLIKRIMIENNANMDTQSAAYAKEYFLQVAQSYEDSAVFNEKILGLISISIDTEQSANLAENIKDLNTLIGHFKENIRKEDMLIRWSDISFLLIYFVNNEDNSRQMLEKLQIILCQKDIKDLQCNFRLSIQEKDESIRMMIRRIDA